MYIFNIYIYIYVCVCVCVLQATSRIRKLVKCLGSYLNAGHLQGFSKKPENDQAFCVSLYNKIHLDFTVPSVCRILDIICYHLDTIWFCFHSSRFFFQVLLPCSSSVTNTNWLGHRKAIHLSC